MLIYDGDCGFCTQCVRWLSRQLRTPISCVPWQEVHDLGDLDLDTEDVRTALYWVDIYGRRYRGARGVAQALRQCRMPFPIAGVLMDLPGIHALMALVYWLVARYRYKLPGSTAGCRLPERVSFAPAGASATGSGEAGAGSG